ncbi:MAG TPA: DUF6734 family protein [Umezawaea sp.]|nr:DUF6734 family protein [Umezawaea sp.]
MRAFHVMSTAPERTYYQRPGGKRFSMEDFEVLVAVLSALKWRQHNGSIKLYTDTTGADYLDRLGLSCVWDDGVDTDVLEKSTLDTSFTTFWASGRTVALEAERAPCVMLDTDLVVWRDIRSLLRAPFTPLHREHFDGWTYVDKEKLHTPPGYVWEDWDWTVSPTNAALMYFGRDDHRAYCAREGLRFLQSNFLEGEEKSQAHAVLVEQRLYAMCAARLGVETEFLLWDHESERLADGGPNDAVTHLWVYKQTLMRDERERRRMCLRLARRIRRDFPGMCATLAEIPSVAPYFRGELDDGPIADS